MIKLVTDDNALYKLSNRITTYCYYCGYTLADAIRLLSGNLCAYDYYLISCFMLITHG